MFSIHRNHVVFGCILSVCLSLGLTGCNRDSDNGTATVDPATKSDPATNNQADENQPDSDSHSDSVQPQPLEAKFTETVPKTLVEFEMVLVPGNDDQQQPFYIGAKEVTWDEFAYWALCEDIKEKKAIVQREKRLRPSAPHDTAAIYRGWGRENQPAVGVSRLSAERYCEWLSEQTGKKYRLPTVQEWEYAFEQGGGKLDTVLTEDRANESAWFLGNTLDEETFDNRAMPVGSKQANALGIFDMLGNAAEWVTGTGEEKVIRGGSFRTPLEELTGQQSEAEDQSIWNKNYPNTPKSEWWYKDADYVGFRIVCEPDSLK